MINFLFTSRREQPICEDNIAFEMPTETIIPIYKYRQMMHFSLNRCTIIIKLFYYKFEENEGHLSAILSFNMELSK